MSDLEVHRMRLIPGRESGSVGTWQNQRSGSSGRAASEPPTAAPTGRLERWGDPEVPHDLLHPRFVGWLERTDHDAARVENLELELTLGGGLGPRRGLARTVGSPVLVIAASHHRRRIELLPQVIADGGAGRGVGRYEGRRLEGPVHPHRPHGRSSRAEQVRVRGEELPAHLLVRGDVVENPDATPMRTHDEIILARVDRDVVHGHGGQAVLQAAPARAAVDRHEHADLVAQEQEVRVAGVLADHVDGPPVR